MLKLQFTHKITTRGRKNFDFLCSYEFRYASYKRKLYQPEHGG
jgi:hypothetical protein